MLMIMRRRSCEECVLWSGDDGAFLSPLFLLHLRFFESELLFYYDGICFLHGRYQLLRDETKAKGVGVF